MTQLRKVVFTGFQLPIIPTRGVADFSGIPKSSAK